MSVGNRPTITCSCSFNGRVGVGVATSKQESKRLAAKNLVMEFEK
jgi:hypothetical protein